MPRAAADEVLYVSEAKKNRIDTLVRGVQLVDKTGYTIGQLRGRAVFDRLALAKRFIEDAEVAIEQNPPRCRTAVSRAYYAMYHLLRTVSYHSHGGDDYEGHDVLPGKIPAAFPNRGSWEHDLKLARLERNRADYEPYPRKDNQFQPTALELIAKARDLDRIVRRFLRANGWKP
jgi:hypothetical protein